MYMGALVTVLMGGTATSWVIPGKGPCKCYCVSLQSQLVHPKLSSSWYKLVFVLLVLLSSFLLKCNSSLEGICMSLKDIKLLFVRIMGYWYALFISPFISCLGSLLMFNV